IIIAVYHGRPIVMIQDAKHALKTYRNNMFSGARYLVIGNDAVCYDIARELAFHDDSPLYHRDVEKVDRQDDNAAARLFSPIALEYLTKRAPDCAAQALYVFNMGEAVDAYLNPEIEHIVRIKMVLRTRFFVDIWRSYLRAAGYAESRYFISREAADITRILVDGLIGLVIVYRDHQDGSTRTPLLPWLHSTEVCEHVFAECRKLVADFTYLDFLYMHPRLQVVLRSIVRFLHTSDPKARAAGYAHTYFDPERVDLAKLAIFPSDIEIRQAAQEAWEEAESLFALVGVVPSDFLSARPTDSMSSRLPSISSWFFNQAEDPDSTSTRPHDVDSESEIESDGDDEEHNEEDPPTPEEVAQREEEDRAALQQAFSDAVRRLQDSLPLEETRLFDRHLRTLEEEIDFSPLIAERRRHETPRAARCVRVGKRNLKASQHPSGAYRGEVLRRMQDVLAQHQEHRVGTGLSRKERWAGPSGATTSAVHAAGNTANAVLAAGQRAAGVITRRSNIFTRYKLPRPDLLADGLVGIPNSGRPYHTPLRKHTYVMVYYEREGQIMIGRVRQIFYREAGKNGKNCWASSADNLGLISYISMQLYDYVGRGQCRAIFGKLASFQTMTFAHLSPDHLLCVLPGQHRLTANRQNLTLDESALTLFEQYQRPSVVHQIANAVKALKTPSRGKKKSGKDGDGSGTDGED
ncbi:hypothetical protein K466DRAFT_507008, partial [Polyporus arcularius HHB13444]